MMNKKRVVVTGLGAITPLGNDIETFWNGIKEGKSGISQLTRVNKDEFPVSVSAEVKDFEATDYMEKKDARKMDLFTQYAIAASSMALKDSGLNITEDNANRVGVWIGCGIGGMDTYEQQLRRFIDKGYKRVSPFFVPMLIPDMAAGQVSIFTGAKGINSCSVTACASGTNSIGDAFEVILRGDADVMITGGTEAPITSLAVAGFIASTALSLNPDPKKASRPFDKDRDGFVMGEGAGILILEEYEHAVARGAKIYAEIVGYGSTGDAHHITAPAPGGEGGARAMQQALAKAGIEPHQIDYINAHATSTPVGDLNEGKALLEIFGAHNTPVSSTKSMTGHEMWMGGASEVIYSILMMQNSFIAPNINFNSPDDELAELNIVSNTVEKKINTILSNSFGFGGTNSTLIISKYNN